MEYEEKNLIREYFDVVSRMQDNGIVRSDKVLGDLGEWICSQEFNLKLETSGRHPGYDGKIGNETVQVKVHNSPKGTNLSVGNPDRYQQLIILIGPRSRLRIGERNESFHVYRFSSSDVVRLMKRTTGHYCARSVLQQVKYVEIKYNA